MNLSRRQQWLVALLPGILLGALYLLAVRPVIQDRLATVNHRLETIGSAEPETKGNAGASAEALARAREEKRELDGKLSALPIRWARPAELAQTVQELAAAFQNEGVQVQSSRPEPDDTAPRIAEPLKKFRDALHELRGGEPRLWRLELFGSYEEIVRALEAYPGVTPLGLPVTIAATLAHGTDLNFTLWFWI